MKKLLFTFVFALLLGIQSQAQAQDFLGAGVGAVTDTVGSAVGNVVSGAVGDTVTGLVGGLAGGTAGDLVGSALDVGGMATGVMVTGECFSTGLIASSAQLTLMSTSMGMAVSDMKSAVVKAIGNSVKSSEALQSAISDKNGQMDATKAELEIQARGVERKMDIIDSAPVEGWCKDNLANVSSAALFLGATQQSAINRVLAQTERNKTYVMQNPGAVETVLNTRARDSDFSRSNMVMFGDSPLYTTEQAKSFSTFIDNLYPADVISKDNVIEEAKTRDTRVLLSEPLRRFLLDRSQTIEAKDVLAWSSKYDIPAPVVTKSETDSKGFVKTTTEAVKSDGKISRDVLYQQAADVYSSPEYFAKLDGKNSTGVLKELVRIQSFTLQALLDIRSGITLGNAIKSVELAGTNEPKTSNN